MGAETREDGVGDGILVLDDLAYPYVCHVFN